MKPAWGKYAVLLILVTGFWVIVFKNFDSDQSPARPVPPFSVLMIGWDGSRLAQIEKLLAAGELPNLKKLIENGSFIKVKVRDGRSDTKAGWTQIFTGYSAAVTGVHGNRDYRPIPPGLTLFERLEGFFGPEIFSGFISGKVNNIGARGPHRICINCKSRFDGTQRKTRWWDEESDAPPKEGKDKIFENREGEPYLHAHKKMDLYRNNLGPAPKVAAVALETLQKIAERKFFLFVHFEEPDEQGHLHREGSPEYLNAMKEADRWTGVLLAAVANRDVKIFILSDHGFNPGENNHRDAPDTFWASNIAGLNGDADRRDFTPTILRLYDFPLGLDPPLNGRPLQP